MRETNNSYTRCAIYARLSEEDRNKSNKDDDSVSIQNQKSMLVSYAVEQGWEIYGIYSDDDFKGSDRKRPAFNQLLKDAETRKFNIVLCKTQSRFTRELELVESIIHGKFVDWGIRFVGLADNADTANKGNKKSRQINGLVNEWYLEDLSDNIKAVLADHQNKGLHTGSFAPYGYVKDPDKKGHLIVDPEAAEIVKEIFDKSAAGIGRTAIARILNQRGVPNPTEYKRLHGETYRCGVGKSNSTLWRYYTIGYILINQMYIGDMVQHRYENPSYKSKHSRPVPKEQWRIVKNTHEPIISLEVWNEVQKRLADNFKPMCSGNLGLFAGKTRCIYCGYSLQTHISKHRHYLRCSLRYATGKENCQGAFVSQKLLEDVVLSELRKLIVSYLDMEEAEAYLKIKNDYQSQQDQLQKNVHTYERRVDELKTAIKNTYLDKSKGLISDAEYLELRNAFQKDIEECEAQISYERALLINIQQSMEQSHSKKEILMKYRDITELTRPVMEHLIDYIEVGRREKEKGLSRKVPPPIIIHWKI